MPAILTHDFFGRDAYDDVSASRGFVTQQQRQAFLLGNQGPDPLFYLVADPLVGRENRVGGLMHHAKPARLLSALRDALNGSANGNGLLFPVDIRGFQGANFSQAHAGIQAQQHGQTAAVRGSQRFLLGAGQHPLLRPFATQRSDFPAGVFRKLFLLHRKLQAGLQQAKNAPNGAWGQAMRFLPFQKVIHITGRDLADGRLPKSRKDMVADLAEIGLIAGGLYAAQYFIFHPV